MKKILLVEDNGSYSKEVEKQLYSSIKDCDVTVAYSYIAALGWWEEEGEFDCIILDLQINPTGLDISKYDEYAPLYGMAVLDEISTNLSENEKLKLYKKIVISSGFVANLRDWLRTRQRRLGPIELIPKNSDNIDRLITKVKKICATD
jgi:CheY-like chemotaxis protein